MTHSAGPEAGITSHVRTRIDLAASEIGNHGALVRPRPHSSRRADASSGRELGAVVGDADGLRLTGDKRRSSRSGPAANHVSHESFWRWQLPDVVRCKDVLLVKVRDAVVELSIRTGIVHIGRIVCSIIKG